MRTIAPNAALAGFCIACGWLLLGSARAAHAQGSDRMDEGALGMRPTEETSALGAQRTPRSVVLKPAARHAPVSLSPATGETPHRSVRLDTVPPRDRWLAMDKAKHLGGSFLVVLGGQYVFEEKAALRRDPALALSLGTGAAVGLGKELYDWRLGPSRHFSARDLAADALGLLLAAGVVLL